MRLLIFISFILIAWKFGDWKNWKQYYPTILYFFLSDMIYEFLCFNYSLWTYHPDKSIPFLNKHTLITIAIDCIVYPATVLIYLGNFPKYGLLKKIGWVSFWISLFVVIEFFTLKSGIFSHHNGWNMWWSVLFNMTIFPILYLHFKRPLWAIILSIPITLFYFYALNIPYEKIK